MCLCGCVVSGVGEGCVCGGGGLLPLTVCYCPIVSYCVEIEMEGGEHLTMASAEVVQGKTSPLVHPQHLRLLRPRWNLHHAPIQTPTKTCIQILAWKDEIIGAVRWEMSKRVNRNSNQHLLVARGKGRKLRRLQLAAIL